MWGVILLLDIPFRLLNKDGKHGERILKKMIKDAKSMTNEEYKKLYNESNKRRVK
jgi:hypothetical protein